MSKLSMLVSKAVAARPTAAALAAAARLNTVEVSLTREAIENEFERLDLAATAAADNFEAHDRWYFEAPNGALAVGVERILGEVAVYQKALFSPLSLGRVTGLDCEAADCQWCWAFRSGKLLAERQALKRKMGKDAWALLKADRCECAAPKPTTARYVRPEAPVAPVTGWVNLATGEWLTDTEAVTRLKAV